ncbi:hypothetical protein BC834DRAFT_37262 [Gloeopeniophorella convolvens]|nr:hypothetical protein BC834DRAFT_37262 [Gloeopeniophorella convolvens]
MGQHGPRARPLPAKLALRQLYNVSVSGHHLHITGATSARPRQVLGSEHNVCRTVAPKYRYRSQLSGCYAVRIPACGEGLTYTSPGKLPVFALHYRDIQHILQSLLRLRFSTSLRLGRPRILPAVSSLSLSYRVSSQNCHMLSYLHVCLRLIGYMLSSGLPLVTSGELGMS